MLNGELLQSNKEIHNEISGGDLDLIAFVFVANKCDKTLCIVAFNLHCT